MKLFIFCLLCLILEIKTGPIESNVQALKTYYFDVYSQIKDSFPNVMGTIAQFDRLANLNSNDATSLKAELKILQDFANQPLPDIKPDALLCELYTAYRKVMPMLKTLTEMYAKMSEVENAKPFVDMYEYWNSTCGEYYFDRTVTLMDFSIDGKDRGKYLSRQYLNNPCCWGKAEVGEWERFKLVYSTIRPFAFFNDDVGINHGLVYLSNEVIYVTFHSERLGDWEKFSVGRACTDPSEIPSTDTPLRLCEPVTFRSVKDSSFFYLGNGYQMTTKQQDNSYWVVFNKDGQIPKHVKAVQKKVAHAKKPKVHKCKIGERKHESH